MGLGVLALLGGVGDELAAEILLAPDALPLRAEVRGQVAAAEGSPGKPVAGTEPASQVLEGLGQELAPVVELPVEFIELGGQLVMPLDVLPDQLDKQPVEAGANKGGVEHAGFLSG